MTRSEQDPTKSPVATCLALAGLILVAALLVSFLFPGSMAGSQTLFSSDLVTDYANYPDTPQAQLTDGCDGGGLYHSEMFSLNGGAPVHDPADLPQFVVGDAITMTWDATTRECVGSRISLDFKVSDGPTFDFSVDQEAVIPFVYTVADGGPGGLTFIAPDLAPFEKGCNYQFDAIVGNPLAIVGPSGSDYSASVRGDDRRSTLIGYRNGAYATCAAEQTTTTSTTAPASTTTTSSTAPATTTSSTVPSTVPAVTEDTTPTCAPVQQVDDQSLSVAAAACVTSGGTTVETSGESATSAGALPASAQRQLANTGANGDLWIAAAILLVCFGWLARIHTEGRS